MALKPFAFCTASVLALGLASVAQAQDTAPQTVADDAAAPSAEDIIVTGVRASIVGALNSRKNNIQIVDSIVAEDVGKLPDNNVVEAL